MPDFGIGEGLLAASLFGGAEAAGAGAFGAGLGAEALGAGALGGAAAGGAAGGLGLGAEVLGAGTLGAGALVGAESGEVAGGLGTGLATDALAPGFGAGGQSAIESFLGGSISPEAANAYAAAPNAATSSIGGAGALPASASPISGGSFDLASAVGGVGESGAAGGALPGAGGGSAGNASLFSKLGSAVTGNPLQAAGVGLGAAGLGYNLYKGSQDSAERKALGASQANLGALGKELQSYLSSGRLPPGMQEKVDRDNAAAKARIIQGYAARGQSTDPSMNSTLAQELAAVDTNSTIQIATVAQQLLSTGIQATGMSNETLAKLLSIDRQRSADVGSAISNFSAVLAGRPPQQARSAA